MATDLQRTVVESLDLARSQLARGDERGHLAALDHALALEPYCFPAYLMKGIYYERKGQHRIAALHYKKALKIIPADDELSPSMVHAARQARDVVDADSREFRRFLQSRIVATRDKYPLARLDRLDHCLDVFAGKSKTYVSEASLLLFPQLPAVPFFDNADFPWMNRLSEQTEAIASELLRARDVETEAFRPYVDARPGEPLNQWAKLNKSSDWTTFYFWREGNKHEEHCVSYPTTAATCAAAPLAEVPGHAPTVMYSCLAGGARIPPHTGVTNTRLVVHLPLVVPPGCGFRVGHITREWKVGIPWVFDDTIEHEAWNNSNQFRAVLIFDIWNPLLAEPEREAVSVLLSASREYLQSA